MTKLINILLLLSFGIVSAHKNVIFQKSYGNVNLISSTSYYTEDINKKIIAAKYVELLLKELQYKDSIYLWFWPDRDKIFKAYFGKEESKLKGLNIFIPEYETDISKTLSLVENVILNQKSLDKERDRLLSWYNSTPSKLIKDIHKNKIYRPKDVPELEHHTDQYYTFDYFYENGTFHILSLQNREVIEAAQVRKILQFKIVTSSLLLIFTETNSLTIISADYKYDGTRYNATSETLKFDFQPEWEYSFRPYKIRLLGRKYITIESIFGDKVSLYNIPKKKLTQDLLAKFEE
jgi:hypothetical protein